MVVALAALLISAMSIFVAQHTSQTMEKLVHANSWPFIQLGSGNATDDLERELSFGVSNVGTGPARIHSFAIEVDGQPGPDNLNYLYGAILLCCEAELAAAMEGARTMTDAIGPELTSPVASRFLAPNDVITAIRWRWTEDNQALWRAVDNARQANRIIMSACYCSVFDECWVAHSHQFPPEPVRSCERATPATRQH